MESFFLLIFIVYILYPAAVLGGGLKYGSGRSLSVLMPLAFGVGPLLATWLAEIYLFVLPGPIVLPMFLAALLVPPLLVVFYYRQQYRTLRGLGGFEAVLLLFWLILLLLFWFISNCDILKTWDITCFRMIASRIAEQGVISPKSLIFEPTKSLLMMHGLHGSRYPLLLALNRIVAGTDAGLLDALPSIWYYWLCVVLLGGSVAERTTWKSLWPWSAAALLVTCHWFNFWPVYGQSISISAFCVLGLVVWLWQPPARKEPLAKSIGFWLMAGVILGLSLNIHRTNLIFLGIYLLFSWAWVDFSLDRKKIWRPLLGLLAAFLVFSPYGPLTLWTVGGLDQANPVSNMLVPYRASWRQAFEHSPLLQSMSMFWSLRDGALVWSGSFLVGCLCLFSAGRRREFGSRSAKFAMALVGSLVVMALVYCDISQLFRLLGQELLVRSTRYRQVMPPLLVFGSMIGLLYLLNLAGARKEKGSWWAVFTVLCGMFMVLASLVLTWNLYQPKRLPGSWTEARNRLVAMLSRDNAALALTNPDRALIDYLQNNAPTNGYTQIDYMKVLPYLDIPLRNMWLNPGIFYLLDAETPKQAYENCKKEKLEMFVQLSNKLGNELQSGTGVRHYFSIHTSSLVFESGSYQVFKLRPEYLEAVEALPDQTMHVGFLNALKSGAEQKHLMVYNDPLTQPGEYEFNISLDSRQKMRIFLINNSKAIRRYNLQAWKPYIAGKHRVRFQVREGDAINLKVKVADPGLWQEIAEPATLLVRPQF